MQSIAAPRSTSPQNGRGGRSTATRFRLCRLARTSLACGAGLLLSSVGRSADQRWNILLVFADDWGRYASCYRAVDGGRPSLNDVIATPHFDRVAREGVLFTNAFVNAPMCTPSRSALLSGRYFFNTGRGANLSGAEWDPTIPSYPLLIREAGYHIGKSYKVWSPGTPVDAPFGGQRYAYEQAGAAPNNFSGEVTARVRAGRSLTAARDEVLAQVRDNFRSFLAARPSGHPWHYFFGPRTTHRIWVKGSGKALWGIDPNRIAGRLPAFLPDVPEVREDMADYLGECQAVDAYLGVLLEAVAAAGELEQTLIVVTGDHGMPGVPSGKSNLYHHGVAVALGIRVPGGKTGRVIDDFVCLPDLAPTFLEIAGVSPPPDLYGRSLLPLLRSNRSGQIDPSRNWVITGRERMVDTAREGNLSYPVRSLRTKDFAYIRNFAPERWPLGSPRAAAPGVAFDAQAWETITRTGFEDMDGSPTKAWLVEHREDAAWNPLYEFTFGKRFAEELYDLKKDRDEMHNVANDPSYGAIKAAMARELMDRLLAARDPRVIGDGLLFDRPPYTDLEAVDPKAPRPKNLPLPRPDARAESPRATPAATP